MSAPFQHCPYIPSGPSVPLPGRAISWPSCGTASTMPQPPSSPWPVVVVFVIILVYIGTMTILGIGLPAILAAVGAASALAITTVSGKAATVMSTLRRLLGTNPASQPGIV